MSKNDTYRISSTTRLTDNRQNNWFKSVYRINDISSLMKDVIQGNDTNHSCCNNQSEGY